jgi:hypothetical protein
MVRNNEKRSDQHEDEVDALFKIPLAEFIAARKALATRLKQSGRSSEADRVKALVKPPISAWAVNQLYWKHREAFDRLIATGERFRKAQSSRLAGKMADMREALDERREALAELTSLATELLNDVGHNPSPDTIRRITSTLEAMSASISLSDGPTPGRLTQDVDPPGFESLASFIPGGATKRTEESARVTPAQKSVSVAATNTRLKAVPAADARQLEKTRQSKIALAKVSLQDAKRVLNAARATALRAEAAQKKADADAKEAEKHSREAEQRLENARAAANDAAERARSVAAEVEEAGQSLEDAERIVKEASGELESLFRKG